jgi:membrane protease YdiL (CAAX protease family)
MEKIIKWIRRHQVLTFIILAYAITWPVLILIFFILPENQEIEVLWPLAIFSPALAAMLISGIAEPHPKHARNKSRWIVFFVTWLVAFMVGITYEWKVQMIDLTASVIVIFCVFALFPAWMVSSVYARNPGISKQFLTLLKPRGPSWWYLVIFLIFPGIQLLDIFVTPLFGGDVYFKLADMSFESAAILLLLEFMYGFFFTGGINEESGWRGFALPRLQARYPVIVAAGIVWFFWAAWHLPYDFGRGDEIAWILENRLLWNLVFAILMTWVYNRTNGSILAPALFHSAMNTFGNNLGAGSFSGILFIGLAILAVVSDQMWKKLPQDHPVVSRIQPEDEDYNQLHTA